ncbi:carboxymuconolactone decarboxylase family protein [Hypericibacter sp.]|uniref:carboxymuconolactone decarboxylase family protein n=1 Tax=Hypericibacter sp. TaxID=2705401 RepID=UPI003D6D541F
MDTRVSIPKAAPAAYKAMTALSNTVEQCGLEHSLLDLVKMRASQINGCAFCLAMHSADARKAGESEARLYLLNGWRETPVYSERERAALAWTEALTLITEGHAPDAIYEEVRRQFSDEELANLTMAIVTINGWNRIAISSRMMPVVAKNIG